MLYCKSTHYVAVALVLGTLTAVQADDKDAKKAGLKPSELAGVYTIVSSINNGKPSQQKNIDGVVVRFTDSAVVVTDRDKNEVYTARYKLGETAQPVVLSMTSTMGGQEVSTQGLVKKDDEQVTLIYALPGSIRTPTDFKPGKGLMLFVLTDAGPGLEKKNAEKKPAEKVEPDDEVPLKKAE